MHFPVPLSSLVICHLKLSLTFFFLPAGCHSEIANSAIVRAYVRSIDGWIEPEKLKQMRKSFLV